jgi:AmiR/NasT family two-component response regulator
MRVFIVEDSVLQAMTLEQYLTEAGHEVIGVATTAARAVQDILRLSPDLILTDIDLGGSESGIDVMLRVGEIARIPHVYVTAYSDPSILNSAQKTNPCAFITKPYLTQDVKDAITRAERLLLSGR